MRRPLRHARAGEILALAANQPILVVGDVMLDHYIWGDVDRISPEAPVPIVDVDRDSYVAGGAANVALNLATLGMRPHLCATVGRDAAGERLMALLAKHQVGFHARLFSSASVSTIEKARVVVRGQQLCRLDREGEPSAYAVRGTRRLTALAEAVARSKAVVLSDYAKGVLDNETVQVVMRAAKAAGSLVALDAKPRRSLAVRGLDLLKCNRKESLQLADLQHQGPGPWPAAEVVARIHDRYAPRHLVITLGADGMLVAAGGRVACTLPTSAREVFDVSGAGDTAIAAITLALVAGCGIVEAVEFGNAASGVVVGKLGTATVTPDELRKHLGG